MLRFTVVALLVGASLALDSSLDAHWAKYKEHHGKTYSRGEDAQRRELFETSVLRINSHNLKHDLGLTTYRLGLNKFADMTTTEFLRFKGLASNATVRRTGATVASPIMGAPSSKDWRKEGYVTGVKNQEQCGSCWAFSATGSLEGQHFAKTGKLVSLSEQNLVDCSGSYGNNGCGGGLMDQAFQYIKANGGIDTEDSYPYTATDGQCRFNQNSIGATVTGFVDVASKDETALKNAVGTVGPVSIGIDASQFSFQLYNGGVYDEPNCSEDMLDHGVLAVGYDTTEDGKDFWIVKNSWGADWGEKGYIRMSRNKNNQCGVATDASYPTV